LLTELNRTALFQIREKKIIDDIFKLVEAPGDRAGLHIPDLVDGVASSNWFARRVSAYVASGIPASPDTDRRWATSGSPLHNQANPENGLLDSNNLKVRRSAVGLLLNEFLRHEEIFPKQLRASIAGKDAPHAHRLGMSF